MYTELASWWPLLSAPEDYAEEAEFYRRLIVENSAREPRTLLELGSGGGNNASHLKRHFSLTLVDLSPGMLEVSRRLNPECEHHAGDMRTVRLGREFDVVFIHDAIDYLTSQDDLRQAIETAFVHCRPGGVALFHPDHVRENFQPDTGHGGHDGEDRAMRFMEWTWDPDPADEYYRVEYVFLLRDSSGQVSCEHDRHECGLFAREFWLSEMEEAGFRARSIPFEHSEVPAGSSELFLCRKLQ
jgi:SAM-dependent methyltransferase